MEKQLIHSSIRTPDGTILVSRHRHDYVGHLDKNGETYILDGGLEYIKTSVNIAPAEDLSLYDDEPHEIIREYLERGGRGKNSDEELKYVKLKDIDNSWLQAIIVYENEYRPQNKMLKYYLAEQKFRKKINNYENRNNI